MRIKRAALGRWAQDQVNRRARPFAGGAIGGQHCRHRVQLVACK